MISIPANLKKDLSQLATVLNQFKSEAVQVKLLEQFLSAPAGPASPAAPDTASAAPVARRRGRPPGSGKKPAAPKEPKAPKAPKAPRKPGRIGATTALQKLAESGFFKTRRSIADVTATTKAKLGTDIPVTNFSGPLARFVEEKKLQRAKNKDGRFEYWAK